MNIKLYEYKNNSFSLIAIIDDAKEFSFEHNVYSAGVFTITINYNIPNAKLFRRGLFVQFENDKRMFGEITTVTNSIGPDGKGSEMLNITGYDARYLFKRRVIKNLNNNENWSLTAKGEICLRKLIYDQCGLGAEEKRRLPITNIIPASADAIGESYSVAESFSNLYDVLTTITKQSKIGWAVEFENNSLNLVVYGENDLSDSVFLSTNYESLANGQFSDTSDSFANSVYIAGKGSGSERDIYEGEDGTPEGLDRFEAFDNQSDMSTEDEYKTEAENILTQYAQTLTISGTGLIKCPYVFKQQYNIGDIVTVEFSGKRAKVQILAVTEKWSFGVYSLQFNFGKPQNTLGEQLQLMLRLIQKASNTSSACESVKWYDVANETEQEQKDVTFNTLGFTGSGSWVSRSSGVTTSLFEICASESLKKFCAVGDRGVILTSSDGVTWTSQISGTSYNFYGVCYSETLGLFVAVGWRGTILTSADGVTWTQQTSGTTSAMFLSVCFSEKLNLFCTVGQNGVIYTSPDGITWTSQTSGVSSIFLREVTYSDDLGIFCIIGYSGTILTSPDGVTWTQQTSGVTNNLNSVTYSETLKIFCVVGVSGTILTSTNGITWTQQTSGVSIFIRDVIYVESLSIFIAVGYNHTILTSPDGVTWTSQYNELTTNILDVSYNDSLGVFGVVGNSGLTASLDVPTFILYLDDENVGSKQYLLYVKNLTYGVKLTTALDTTKNTTVKAGMGIYTAWVAPDGGILLK